MSFLKNKFITKVVKFNEINERVSGIDIGSREIYVSIDGEIVVKFKTFTADYHLCCKYLQENGIESVAMEATGSRYEAKNYLLFIINIIQIRIAV